MSIESRESLLQKLRDSGYASVADGIDRGIKRWDKEQAARMSSPLAPLVEGLILGHYWGTDP